MDDSPTPIAGTSSSVHNQHALANCKTIPVNMIPNLLDDDVALLNETVKNPLTQANASSQRMKQRHVEVYTDGKVSHVNGNAVLANGNAGLTNGGAASAEVENVLANGTAIDGNIRIVNGQSTSERNSGYKSKKAESPHR